MVRGDTGNLPRCVHLTEPEPSQKQTLEVTMKMVKSLLLGSAAGLVAVAGAQAADLPVKAKPVEYVKICSLYGDGFFYIPGTDTCLKIGGWVRTEYNSHLGGSASPVVGASSKSNYADYFWRARFVTSFDVRTQTQYGVLRAYTRAGMEMNAGQYNQGNVYFERAFIQFAGFTFGKTASYFDFMVGAFGYSQAYLGGGSVYGGGGINLVAYTAQLGNGLTATLSLEDNGQRRNALWDATVNWATNTPTNPLALGALPGPYSYAPGSYATCGEGAVCPTGDYAAVSIPDIVGSLRVDQAWGSAQIAAALHQVKGTLYGHDNLGTDLTYTGVAPDDKWGYAIMGGLVLNLPWAKGDKFYIEATYAKGALTYMGLGANGTFPTFARTAGGAVAAGWALDGVFANNAPGNTNGVANGATGIQLTSAWGINAALEHYWTPALRSSVFGGYNSVSFNDLASALICSSAGPYRTAAGATPAAGTTLFGAGCDPDFRFWGIGTRTVWNPVRNLDIGLELVYTQVDQSSDNRVALNFAGAGAKKAGLYTPSDEGSWGTTIRLQRNFWP